MVLLIFLFSARPRPFFRPPPSIKRRRQRRGQRPPALKLNPLNPRNGIQPREQRAHARLARVHGHVGREQAPLVHHPVLVLRLASFAIVVDGAPPRARGEGRLRRGVAAQVEVVNCAAGEGALRGEGEGEHRVGGGGGGGRAASGDSGLFQDAFRAVHCRRFFLGSFGFWLDLEVGFWESRRIARDARRRSVSLDNSSIVLSPMDDPPTPSGPGTIADNWVSVCSVCELVFRDFDPDAANNGWIQSPAAVRISDLLKPDALDCPFCSSVKLSIPIELRGRHDLRLEVTWHSRQKILHVLYCVSTRF